MPPPRKPTLDAAEYQGEPGGRKRRKPIGVPEGYAHTAPGLQVNTDPFGIREKLTGGMPDTRSQREKLRGDAGNILHQTSGQDPNRFRVTTPTQYTEPRYFEGDEITIPTAARREKVAGLQRDLAAVGLLKGDFALGSWQQGSQKAFGQLLGYANATGQDWESALQELSASPAVAVDDNGNIVARGDVPDEDRFIQGRYIPGDFRADAYLEPDEADLTQRIKEQFRQVLGREPREGELGAYVAQLAAADREAYEANLAAARAEFEADEVSRERSFLQQDEERERQFVESGGLPGAEGDREIPEMVQPEDQQAVNPIARFRERFEQDYAGSISRNRRIGEAAEGRQSFMQSVLGMDAAIGGR